MQTMQKRNKKGKKYLWITRSLKENIAKPSWKTANYTFIHETKHVAIKLQNSEKINARLENIKWKQRKANPKNSLVEIFPPNQRCAASAEKKSKKENSSFCFWVTQKCRIAH